MLKNCIKEILKIEYSFYKTSGDIDGTFDGMAGPELALGQPRRAAILLAVADSLRRKNLQRFTHQIHEGMVKKYIADAVNKLGEDEFEKAWEEGQNMTFETALSFALEEDPNMNL